MKGKSQPATCAKFKCAEPSNGIAPFGFCVTHYREYETRLAERSMLESFVRVSLAIGEVTDHDDSRTRLLDGAAGGKALLNGRASVGEVMDAIAAGADELIWVRNMKGVQA